MKMVALILFGVAALTLATTDAAGARPVCRYPVEMYRPSLGICVPKASFGGERGRVRHRTRREVHRERSPPVVPLPAPRPDPKEDEVWPDPPSLFDMRFYALPPGVPTGEP